MIRTWSWFGRLSANVGALVVHRRGGDLAGTVEEHLIVYDGLQAIRQAAVRIRLLIAVRLHVEGCKAAGPLPRTTHPVHLNGPPLIEHVHQITDHGHEHIAHRCLALHELAGQEIPIGVALLPPAVARHRHVHTDGILNGQDVRSIGCIVAIGAVALARILVASADGLLHVVLQFGVEHAEAADCQATMTSLPQGTVRRLRAGLHAEELRGGAPHVHANALLAGQVMVLRLRQHLERLVLLRLVMDVLQTRIAGHLAAVQLVLIGSGRHGHIATALETLRLHGHHAGLQTLTGHLLIQTAHHWHGHRHGQRYGNRTDGTRRLCGLMNSCGAAHRIAVQASSRWILGFYLAHGTAAGWHHNH